MKIKTKNSGVSFAIGMIVSTILLSVGLTIFESVSRVAEQGYDLDAKNKLYYLNESGFEAALYHHNNLEGKGLNIADQTEGSEITWSITGRQAQPSSPTDDADNILTGILKESETIEIPFYYDSRASLDEDEDIQQITENFSLDFSRFEFNSDGSESSTEIIQTIGETSGQFNFPDGDDDSSVFRNNVLISWSATRKNNGNIETFVPRSDHINTNGDDSLCLDPFLADTFIDEGSGSSFYCEKYLNDGFESDKIISSSLAIIGYILPGQKEAYLNEFWDGSDTNGNDITDRKLSFRPLTFFYNDNETSEKIKGIPWKLTVKSDIPTPTFKIVTEASLRGVGGSFEKTESRTLDEKTAISSFDNFNAE